MEKPNGSNLLNKINQIDNKLRNLKKEKEDLQEGCKHLGETYLAFSGDERNSIRVYCSQCTKEIRYPNPKEVKIWLSKTKE